MALISRKYIDDHDFVARYLANQLSEAEQESFEAYYLEHPELLRELNRTAQFKSGLIDLQESGTLQKLIEERPRWRRAGTIAIAASLLVVVVAGSVWFSSQHGSQPLLAASVKTLTPLLHSALPVASAFDIQRTRTSSYDATITRPDSAAAIELRIKPEVPAVPAVYRVSVGVVAANDSVTELATASGLQTAKDGFVTVYLSAATLAPAVYQLKISGDANTNAANASSSFLVELVPSSN